MTDIIKRNVDTIKDIASKINKLIKVYAEKEGLMPYLKNSQVSLEHLSTDDDSFEKIDKYSIAVNEYCSESKDIHTRKSYEIWSSFASEVELEMNLAARHMPDSQPLVRNALKSSTSPMPQALRPNCGKWRSSEAIKDWLI